MKVELRGVKVVAGPVSCEQSVTFGQAGVSYVLCSYPAGGRTGSAGLDGLPV